MINHSNVAEENVPEQIREGEVVPEYPEEKESPNTKEESTVEVSPGALHSL